jgi:hypothetical protein
MAKTEGGYETYSAQEWLVKHLSISFFILDNEEMNNLLTKKQFILCFIKNLFSLIVFQNLDLCFIV